MGPTHIHGAVLEQLSAIQLERRWQSMGTNRLETRIGGVITVLTTDVSVTGGWTFGELPTYPDSDDSA
ncbi:MAG: hypothetical protein F6K00_30440 [Leptolyngbya sp. SIOISBB]|nr:hypothetical protein [Leptolyngbya sp. SIOISBB]